MDVQQLRDDVRARRVSADRLVDLIVALQRELRAAQDRIADLERKRGESPRPRVDEPYSLRAEEQRQKDKGKKPRKRNKPARKGRITTAQKLAQAERTEPVFPQDVPEHECRYSHTRPDQPSVGARDWSTAGRSSWRTKFIAGRGIATARFPACWTAAPCLRRKRAASES